MRIRILVLGFLASFALFLLPVSALEHKGTREANIERIIKAMGLRETWGMQVSHSRKASLEQNLAVLDSMFGNQNLDEEQRVCIKALFEETLINQIDSSIIDADTMVDVWIKYYGESLTDKELVEIADSLESDLSKKIVQEERNTLAKFNNEIQEMRLSKSNNIGNQLMHDLAKAMNSTDCQKVEEVNEVESE